MQKYLRNAKNKKYTAGYFASLFSHFGLLFSHFAPFCARVGIHAKHQKLATDNLRDVCEARKTCETQETRNKKGCTRDSAKIDNKHFIIPLFSSKNKFYPLSHEKIPLSWA